MQRIKVGISSCVLGNKVRYNEKHNLSLLCTRELARYFEYIPLCPEVGIGMGVPRSPIRLMGDLLSPEVRQVDDFNENFTGRLRHFRLEQEPLLNTVCGYIFTRGSPSCGVFKVKVYENNGCLSSESGMGVFARAVIDAYPELPVEEAERLQDVEIKENFVKKVFEYHQRKFSKVE